MAMRCPTCGNGPVFETTELTQKMNEEDAIAFAGKLRELIDSEGWGLFQELLKMARIAVRELTFSSDFETATRTVAYNKGVQDGLTRAEQMPGEIVAAALRAEVKEEVKGKLIPFRAAAFAGEAELTL